MFGILDGSESTDKTIKKMHETEPDCEPFVFVVRGPPGDMKHWNERCTQPQVNTHTHAETYGRILNSDHTSQQV